MSKFVSAVIVAAGSSTRMGTADSKQFIPLLGKPVIEYTLNAFQQSGLVSEIIVVCREQDYERIKSLAEESSITKLTSLVAGGDSRAESVKNGIKAVSTNAEYLAIHDGARPLISTKEINSVIEKAFETDAATLGTTVTDTIKVVDSENVIVSTPSRSTLRAVQTPQVFDREIYEFALDKAGDDLDSFTDDCSLIENLGVEIQIVQGSTENIKLTTPMDIIIAESILSRRSKS
ncbi:MAG TPA: 2-C-methyl-D-erythritol 4-phosphate cytidylyltransferase [Ruminococcaceae bacterium]|nr:2-C-methyl-D-erythritol 4-phosphate cytidylyltransferase [Oscillospiraceae bacterium]